MCLVAEPELVQKLPVILAAPQKPAAVDRLCLFVDLSQRLVDRDLTWEQLAVGPGWPGSATPERMTFERASFERTIFSDCTFERLTIGAIHRLSECHFSDYRIQRVPISTQPI